jgi:predicted DNA-binding protein (MmcQ/YjbR family)
LPDGEGVSKTVPILRGAFGMAVTVAPDGAVRFRGAGEGDGRGICARPCGQRPGRLRGRRAQGLRKERWLDIAARCFDTEILRAEQTRRTLAWIRSEFSAGPEFLWEKYPDYAAFRRPDNRKWFAVIMTVDRGKLGLPGRGNVEIIDLKALPADVEARLAEGRFLKAYHMNKTHWFTACLDGSVPDEELFALIAESWRQAK